MSLSDSRNAGLLKACFVCAWTNLEGDKRAGHSPRVGRHQDPLGHPRGSAAANLQLLVYTPDARLIHAVVGAVGPNTLRWELLQALATYEALRGLEGRKARAAVRARQRAMRDAVEAFDRKLRRGAFDDERPGMPGRLPASFVRSAELDRRILEDHPLVPAADMQTKWLVRNRSNRGFSSDEEVPDVAGSGRFRFPPRRPLDPQDLQIPFAWKLLPAPRCRVVLTALGVSPPRAKAPSEKGRPAKEDPDPASGGSEDAHPGKPGSKKQG